MNVMEELAKWDGCDAIIHIGLLVRILTEYYISTVRKADASYPLETLGNMRKVQFEFEEEFMEHIVGLMGKYHKPIFGVYGLTDGNDKTVFHAGEGIYKPVFFDTPGGAVGACARMLEHHRFIAANS